MEHFEHEFGQIDRRLSPSFEVWGLSETHTFFLWGGQQANLVFMTFGQLRVGLACGIRVIPHQEFTGSVGSRELQIGPLTRQFSECSVLD
jgi:hypothetical protein